MVARLWLVLLITVGGVSLWDASGAGAQAACRGVAQCVVAGLTNSDVYLDPYMIANGKIRPTDKAALQLVVKSAAKRGVPVKISVSRYPSKSYADAYAAARALRHFLDFSGVLILIAPNGIGVSSNTLNLGEIQAIEEHARPLCFAGKTVQCAAVAADAAASQVISNQNTANRNRALFWLVALVLFGAVIAFLVWRTAGARRRLAGRMNDVRAAAETTLSSAESAIEQIETAGAAPLDEHIRSEYDRGLALRDQARRELHRASSRETLLQANQDAAGAVLALQGVMRALKIESPLSNPLESPSRRCFYCSHDDRPPYTQRTISDDHGNSMQVDVCGICAAELEQGRQPHVATVSFNGAMVPWWAAPTSPWYYQYGGPTWQYWLPFVAGMDVGAWFGGGWGFGGPGYGSNVDQGGGWASDGGAGVSGGTVDPATDQGAGDYVGWGRDQGSTSDGGAGDWGGGDPGGWDSGGGGDWGSGGDGGGNGGW